MGHAGRQGEIGEQGAVLLADDLQRLAARTMSGKSSQQLELESGLGIGVGQRHFHGDFQDLRV
jgi:hypothetical protein